MILAFSFSPLTWVMVDASLWMQPLHSNEKVLNDIEWHWKTIANTLILFLILRDQDRLSKFHQGVTFCRAINPILLLLSHLTIPQKLILFLDERCGELYFMKNLLFRYMNLYCKI